MTKVLKKELKYNMRRLPQPPQGLVLSVRTFHPSVDIQTRTVDDRIKLKIHVVEFS